MWGKGDQSMSGDFGNTTGGGYLTKTTDFDSPKGTGKKPAGTGGKRANSVTPVNIAMITGCRKEEFTLFDQPTFILKFVAIVRKFEVTSTTVTYDLEDHTGTIKAVLWLEHDSATSSEIPVDKENIYARVYGTLRVRNDAKVIMILKIAPIDSLNEITCHIMEVIFVLVMAEKKAKGEGVAIQQKNPGAELSNSMATYDGGAAMEEVTMTTVQRQIYQYMKTVQITTEAGIDRKDIWAQFPPKQRSEVDDAIHFLVGEGHIFSTVDSDHFQLTTT